MQAIVTKYIAPANVKGSRVKATCQAGSVTLHWDNALNGDQNHCEAAKRLAEKLGWDYGQWIGGGLPDGSMAWVCHTQDARKGSECFTIITIPRVASVTA